MQIQVKTDNHTQGSDELTRQIVDVVENALLHFADRTTRVEVHLSDVNSSQKFGEKDKRCVMEARLAGLTPITVSHRGSFQKQAIDGAASKLEKTLKRALERKNSLFKRRARVRTEIAALDPLLQRDAVSGSREEFFSLLRPQLSDLRDHASRELRVLEMNGGLASDRVTVDELLDEVLGYAWMRFASRSQQMPLDLWLVNLLDETLVEMTKPRQLVKQSIEQDADEMCSMSVPQVDDQQWWVWLLGDREIDSLGEAIPSRESASVADQLEAKELKDRVHALLGELPRAQRQAFVLNILEAFELFEIAMLQERSETEVQADIEAAHNMLVERLGAAVRSQPTAHFATNGSAVGSAKENGM